MSLEHSPVRAPGSTAVVDNDSEDLISEAEFWNALIDEKAAGDFLDLSPRTMQAMRQRGGGPQYVLISARCVRYRRADLRAWADRRVRVSTSDPGREAA